MAAPLDNKLIVNATWGPSMNVTFQVEGPVVYLMGPNAAGKSSILDSFAQPAVKPGARATIKNLGNQNALKVHTAAWGSAPYDAELDDANHREKIRQHFEDLGQLSAFVVGTKEDGVIDRHQDDNGNWVPERAREIEDVRLAGRPWEGDLDQLSHGSREWWNLRHWIPEFPGAGQSRHVAVLTLDEPERGLHPGLQRRVPELLDEWITEHAKTIPAQKLIVVVATQSPFILGGAVGRPGHSVLALEYRELKQLGRDDVALNGDGVVRAVSPMDALPDVNAMLGAGVKDLVPKPMIVAEYSVIVAMRAMADHLGVEVPGLMVDASGDSVAVARLERMLEVIRRVKEDWPEKLLFDFDWEVVIDSETDYAEGVARAGLAPNHVHRIGLHELEDTYPRDMVNDYLASKKLTAWPEGVTLKKHLERAHDITDRHEVGKHKADLARYVVRTAGSDDVRRHLRQLAELVEKLTPS